MLDNFKEQNIWMIDNEKLRERLLNNNYIKKAKINKNYPNTITITLEERRPIGKINNNGHYLVFDQFGYILEEGSLKSKVEVPVINQIGYSFSNNKIKFTPIFQKIVQALNQIQQNKISQLESIKKENDKIILKTNSNVVTYLGEAEDLSRKVNILSAIIDKIKKQNLNVKYINLKYVEKPVIKLNK
jgi:cell division protein FtsQ